MALKSMVLLFCTAALTLANPVVVRHNRHKHNKIDKDAFKEAQQRDNTATRAFSNIHIKTSEGKCLFVDLQSGDFRANLTPIQTADCGATHGQGWDIITSGKHNDQEGFVLIVSTLTQACFSADSRRDPGSQIHLFSCGGRADGSGEVSDSQLFATDGPVGNLRLSPKNGAGFCLIGSSKAVDIVRCDAVAPEQRFILGDGAAGGGGISSPSATTGSLPAKKTTTTNSPPMVTATISLPVSEPGATSPAGANPTANPTSPVPVSRAGGTLNPTAAAEAHEFDDTATRNLQSVHVRSSDGRCLSVDPTAGDFRQNLIPVAMAKCAADQAGQKFDIVTAGKHNNGDLGRALVVSTLMNGCLSFDGRRNKGDTVTMFSCGGRAAGGEYRPPRNIMSSLQIISSDILGRWRNRQCAALSFRWIRPNDPRASVGQWTSLSGLWGAETGIRGLHRQQDAGI